MVRIDDGIGSVNMGYARKWIGIPPHVLLSEAHLVVTCVVDEMSAKPQVELMWNGQPVGSLPASWLRPYGMLIH